MLLAEALDALAVKPGGTYLDATVGGGGHAEAILERVGLLGRLLGIDRDPAALAVAQARLSRFPNAVLARGAFSSMIELARANGMEAVDGVLLDLGVSSFQLDQAERGFSFQREGPLDMRMDPDGPTTAADLVNRAGEAELADWIRRFGEEPMARRIARQIVAARAKGPIRTTTELAAIVERAKGGHRGRIHPATKTFQALRMVVNDELAELEAGLEAAVRLLKPGGRLAVIAFHSLEDRLVKQRLSRHIPRRVSLAEGGEREEFVPPRLRWVFKGARMPGEEEVARNPRARSARLRAVERIE